MGHPLPLISRRDRHSARALVEGCGLRFEEELDDLVGVFAGGRLAGCGARRGRVLKMLVVAAEHRGAGLLGDIVTELMRRGREAGCDGFFIFTRPATAAAFQALGFKPLAEHEQAVLLEQGNGVQGWRRRQAALARGGDNAALIAAAPFSPQQQRLVVAAAALADTLYVLV
nr:citrate lyase ligase [Pseudomonadota bacterium]